MVKILAIGGSLRKDSFNKKLANLAAIAAKKSGAEVTLVNMADYPLPIYNGDDEEKGGLPENAKKLKKLFFEHDGFLIASPEYNSSISGPFKNLIDWISRPEKQDVNQMPAFFGKWAALLAASPGALGGLRGLVHLRQILGNIAVHVIPDQVTVSKAHEAFDEKGELKDAKLQQKVATLAENFVKLLKKVN
jgi:NAD(P)H-dependent FMN reductase